jgi:hypothetical protein
MKIVQLQGKTILLWYFKAVEEDALKRNKREGDKRTREKIDKIT